MLTLVFLRRPESIRVLQAALESSSVALPFQGVTADVVEIPEWSVVAEGSWTRAARSHLRSVPMPGPGRAMQKRRLRTSISITRSGPWCDARGAASAPGSRHAARGRTGHGMWNEQARAHRSRAHDVARLSCGRSGTANPGTRATRRRSSRGIPLIPLNPGKSRTRKCVARGGTRNRTARVVRNAGQAVAHVDRWPMLTMRRHKCGVIIPAGRADPTPYL